tara:strand:- start:12645 stop:15074 length:2430 start_codon:yes stop_codon:yes gene_type:complete
MKKIVTTIILLIILINNILPKENKKIGLVLSGGGLKGFGHLGTLYMIDSLNIPIDFISGSSIGAISAALYATGHSVYEIDKIGSDTKWKEIFSQSRKRSELHFFQKKDNAKFQLAFNLRGFKPTSPISITNGQYSYEHLINIFNNYVNVNNYDELIIPFRCNATDIISGEEVIFDKGSIPTALRISTSIPTVFSPIEYENKLLVDGGLINNLPVNLVENLGAEYIISSNVMAQNKSKDEIVDVFNMVFKIIDLYGDKNEQINLAKSDILVSPNLDRMNVINYNLREIYKMKLSGKKAAYSNINKFLALENKNNKLINLASIPQNTITIDSIILSSDMVDDVRISNLFKPNENMSKDQITDNLLEIRRSQKYYNIYSKYKKNTYDQSYNLYIYGIKHKPIFINKIKVSGNKKINDKEILNMFSISENQELDPKILNEDIKKIYNTERFEYINYDIIKTDDNNYTLVVNLKESENKRLKLGTVWDNYHKLIGKVKLDIFNKPFKNFRLQNELLFSGIKQNKFTLYYLFNNNKIIPFMEFTNQIKNIEQINFSSQLTADDLQLKFKEHAIGLIYPMSNLGNLSISWNSTQYQQTFHHSALQRVMKYHDHYIKIKFNIDKIDDLLHPRNGYQINIMHQRSNKDHVYWYGSDGTSGITEGTIEGGNQTGWGYNSLIIDYYKTYHYNHTIRLFSQLINGQNNNPLPLNLQINYGGNNWAVGYDEYALSGNKLELFGMEYQYHFRNSLTYRFMINWVSKITRSYNDEYAPVHYGIGVKVRSFIGPLDFTWGRGRSEPFNKNSKEINIFYFNFGVAL